MSAKSSKDKAHFWRDSLLGDLEFLHANYVTHSFVRHAHDEFAIGVIYAGVQAVGYRRADQLLMPAGSIAAINPGEMHTGYAANPEEGWRYRMFYPKPDLLKRVFVEITGREHDVPFLTQPVIFDDRLARKIYRMHCVLESPETSAIERETYLLDVLAQLVIGYADSRPVILPLQPEDSIVQRIRNYLMLNYRHNVSLTELSGLTNLSKFYVCRVFKEAMGLPPHAYLNLIRVHQAKQLLKLGIPIAEVALNVGFFDQTHLNKRFKGVLGVTPRQYAKGATRTY
ncbi:MAG: AraC family transcriptional regulator [Cyanobacteria bacterium J06635_15]